MSAVGRMLLVFLLGAGALHLVVRLSAKEPAPARAPQAGQGAAAAFMQARVDHLERQMATLRRSPPGSTSLAASGQADRAAAEEARHAERAEAAERAKAGQRRLSPAEEEAALGKMFEGEPRDRSWAEERETRLRTTLAQRFPDAAAASDVACRASICRIRVEHADAVASLAFRRDSGLDLIGDFAALHFGDPEGSEGRHATEVLLFRDPPPRDIRLRRR